MTNEDWLQAQYSVLGAALIEPDLVPKVIQQTRSADFSGACQTVYLAMHKLFQSGAPVDAVTLRSVLGAEYSSFLTQLMNITPTTANLDHYIRLCRERAKILSVRDLALRLSTAEDSESIRKLLDEANGLMVDKPTLRITTMADALKSFMERHTGEAKYITWPIRELNERLYAEPGDFILIGGYPSSGKSAWSIQCAKHWARSEKVGFFSLETSDGKLFDRQMASTTDLTMDDIKRNNISSSAWDQIAGMSDEVIGLKLEIIPAAGMTPADIRSVTMMRGYRIIIIDYVQLLQSSGGTRTEQVTNISLALHRMAQDMRVTIVALSQLKRKGDDSAPESSDLRESGQLEQDADIIMMLKLENKDNPGGNRQLFITKNKEGTCPMIVLAFDGKHQTFSKASRTGETVGKYTSDGRNAQRKKRTDGNEQMTILPRDYEVPF